MMEHVIAAWLMGGTIQKEGIEERPDRLLSLACRRVVTLEGPGLKIFASADP